MPGATIGLNAVACRIASRALTETPQGLLLKHGAKNLW